ncbi:hypothetical protein RRG08_001248 [Elysia crispata]|uniref:Uncharacterized protein n=1 Tax=Elysia crispata TaxID=231223 RepID=A0AAE1EB51_9GAST|nr:hypothetical protein RRG08_001248 [Elysia crispata]
MSRCVHFRGGAGNRDEHIYWGEKEGKRVEGEVEELQAEDVRHHNTIILSNTIDHSRSQSYRSCAGAESRRSMLDSWTHTRAPTVTGQRKTL